MSKTHNEKPLITSKEAKKLLKVSDCHLAHLRMEGMLPFVKKGNAYLYELSGLNDFIKIPDFS
ncbi:MAG: helix-turn-helix domain-containing protein [Saprospiraceae bacterium]|nr:helix-turn-helix domain-containing protein [Saprospiraceae bacterium]